MDAVHSASPCFEAFQLMAGDPAGPVWLARFREAAIARFEAMGFPQRKQENWRFTDLRGLAKAPFLTVPEPGRASSTAVKWSLKGKAHRLVMVDGRYAPELSAAGDLPPGVWLGSMASALLERPDDLRAALETGGERLCSRRGADQPLAALNDAFFSDGLVLILDQGVTLACPVEMVHIATGCGTCHPRTMVLAGAGSQADLFEHFTGNGDGWTNLVSMVLVGEGARIRHVHIQDEAGNANHTALLRASLDRNARYDSFALMVGARLSRREAQVMMTGSGAVAVLNGASLLRGRQEATFVPLVTHAAPDCQTVELARSVLEDEAHGVFQGTIAVWPGADGTNARQLNRTLLLSRTATVDSKPELEILADDVKCSHGATVGTLDENSLFYLMARGIPLQEARQMLVEAFVEEGIQATDLGQSLSAPLQSRLQYWLHGHRGGSGQ